MGYIKEEEIVQNNIKLSKTPIHLDKYDMYYVEFLMRTGLTKKVRVFCEKGTFPEFNSNEFKRLQQVYGSKLLTDFFVKRLIGEQGLMNKEGRDDFIYLGVIEKDISNLQGSIETENTLDGIPTENFQANHPIVGSEVYQYGNNIVVEIEGKYWLYEQYEEYR